MSKTPAKRKQEIVAKDLNLKIQQDHNEDSSNMNEMVKESKSNNTKNHDNGNGNRRDMSSNNQNKKKMRNQQRKKWKTSYSNQKIRFWVDSCNPTKKPPKNVDKERIVKLLITAVELSDNHKHGNIYNHAPNNNDENDDENIIHPAIQLEEEMKTEVVEDIQKEEVTHQNNLNENEISTKDDVVEQEDDKGVQDDDKNRQERNEEMKIQVEDKLKKRRTGNPFIHIFHSNLENHHKVRLFQIVYSSFLLWSRPIFSYIFDKRQRN